MKAALVLLLAASPAMACDWQIISRKQNPMTDEMNCTIASPSSGMVLVVNPNRTMFTGIGALRQTGMTVRIDENDPISIPDAGARIRPINANRDQLAVEQIMSGRRLRAQYRAYPNDGEVDVEICTLPELIRSCQAP